jgi:hypothetical protein
MLELPSDIGLVGHKQQTAVTVIGRSLGQGRTVRDPAPQDPMTIGFACRQPFSVAPADMGEPRCVFGDGRAIFVAPDNPLRNIVWADTERVSLLLHCRSERANVLLKLEESEVGAIGRPRW